MSVSRHLFNALTRYMLRSGLMLAVDGASLLAAATVPDGAAPAAAAAPAAPAATPPTPEPAAPAPAAAAPANPDPSKPAGSEPAAEGAPESYADWTLPEGVSLTPELATEIGALAKAHNLPQAEAQKLVDIGAKVAQTQLAAQVETVKTLQAQWAEQAKTDKEFGGEKLAENLGRAKAAMLATSTPQLQTLLENSGLAHHPDVIRHFLKIAPAVLPDTHVPGGLQPLASGKSAAQILYDSTN